ncbi:response regulator transcription factor [Gammaproteobacteria bacterium]|nr:response regulator transcription factor [Gammaproteobacteria bacterium]
MTGVTVKIVLVDDHAVVRAGYRLLLENNPELVVVAELASGEEANQEIAELNPDIVIMDLSMPGMGGLEAIRRIKSKDKNIKILVFTMHDNITFVEHAFNAGASGYVTKSSAPNVLVQAVHQIVSGEKYIDPVLEESLSIQQTLGAGSPFSNLSKREFQIFCMFAEGLNTNDIAEGLSLSMKTVANYQTQIKEKLGINSTSELVRLAISNGVVKL